MDVRVGLWRRLRAKLLLLNCGVGEDSWESLGLWGDPTSPFWKRSVLGFLWKEWCWLGGGGEGADRGWDGWMTSLTRWTWVWVNSGSWWWTGRPGVLRFMGLQRVGHDWATELNWAELSHKKRVKFCYLPHMDRLGGHYTKWNVRQGQILFYLTYMWNLKKIQQTVEYRKKKQTHRHGE